MTEIGLHLPEPPSANVYYRRAGKHMHISADGKAYKAAVKAAYVREFLHFRIAVPSAPVSVQIVWTRGRKSGDLDNRIKPVLDALKGLAFTDDKQVVELHAYRRDKAKLAGVQVVITQLAA